MILEFDLCFCSFALRVSEFLFSNSSVAIFNLRLTFFMAEEIIITFIFSLKFILCYGVWFYFFCRTILVFTFKIFGETKRERNGKRRQDAMNLGRCGLIVVLDRISPGTTIFPDMDELACCVVSVSPKNLRKEVD